MLNEGIVRFSFMNQQELQPKAIAEVEEPTRSYVKWAGVLQTWGCRIDRL